MNDKKIAVLIPCYNEELTVAKVIKDFKEQIPEAEIIVYDNNSKDKTADLARQAGAKVIAERNQGKGNVVRSMFRDIDADIYVLTDGDDTYPADEVYKLIDGIRDGYDMVIGDRLSSTYYQENKRPFHNLGNTMVRWLINKIFDNDIKDVMTGYRAFNKKFVKTVPVMSPGFQIETELTITALEYRYNILSVPIQYRDRPQGSSSKLNTFSDGFKVLLTLFDMAKDFRPLWFFGIFALVFLISGFLITFSGLKGFSVFKNVSSSFSIVSGMFMFVFSFLFASLGMILDHQANIDKKNHELYVNEWVNRNR